MNHYDWLISRLDAFIRKYYVNQLLRGSLILFTCLLLYILLISLGEYFLFLPVWVKLILVGLLLVLGTVAVIAWIILPLTKMSRLGKIISHEQAASIVGNHFPEISDRLLNILQLRKQSTSSTSLELIEASINQKAKQLSVIPITQAIDLSKNKKYLPFLMPVLLVALFILLAAPNVFKEASERLLQPTRTFEKPAPFQFVIRSLPLQAVRNSDFTIQILLEGKTIPADVYMIINDERIPMSSLKAHAFEYTFRNVIQETEFRFFAAGFYSQPYILKVVQKPVLKALKMQLDYPDYTGKKDEERNNLGDIILPAGTKVIWGFMAEHTDKATIRFGEGKESTMPGNQGVYAWQSRFIHDTSFTISLFNNESGITDRFTYQVQVIPDQYPVIQMQEFRDSVSGTQILLNGTAGDDYGISKILFHYQVNDENNKALLNKSVPLQIVTGSVSAFQHYFDVDILNLQPGQKLEYYVEAWDNDGVFGSKASRSEMMSYRMYDAKQLDSALNANARQINSGLSNSSEQTKQLQEEFESLQNKMLQTDKMDWEQQQSLKELMEKQQQLKQLIENTKKKFEEQIKQTQQKEFSEDLKEKQNELQKQLDNMLNKELAEQLKKLQEMMAKLNKDNAVQTMKQMQQDNKLFKMDLERIQELMKKLEMQMKMEDLANKMDSLAKEQLDLKKQTDENAKANNKLTKDQNDLQKKLDDAMNNEMKDLKKQNDKMEKETDLKEAQKNAEEAKKNMEESEEQLEQQQKSQSSQSQSKAAKNLQDMARSLRESASGMNMEQLDIDIKATRQLLTNLIRLSFDQEQLMKTAQTTSLASQTFLNNIQEQKRLHNNSKMIRDSLFSLSKRIYQLAAAVNKETAELERNMSYSVDALEGRRIGEAVTKQQYVMTRTNNLALMLNELLSNLMSESNSEKKGSCNKPGGKSPKPGAGKQLSDIITQQKDLGNAMQQMQDAMKRKTGEQPGKEGEKGEKGEQGKAGKSGQQGQGQGEQGNQSGDGEYGDPEQLARMAQQQAAIRRQLQELNSLLNSKGLGNAKEIKELQEKMDRTETDLVNRKLSSDLFLRQRDILTRLLETEKAIREQEQDDKRSSKTPEEMSRMVPPELQRYMKDRESLLELYKTVPIQLKPYYKTMVEQYFKVIGQ